MRRMAQVGAGFLFVLPLAAVIAAGRQAPPAVQSVLFGDLYIDADRVGALVSSPTRASIQAFDVSDDGDIAAVLSDQRVVRVSRSGETTQATMRSRSGAAREGFAGAERWIVAPPRATLVDATGSIIRSITVVPRMTAVTALRNGDLAFLTPGASTLITLMNRHGVRTASFGSAIPAPQASAAQRAWLNEGTLIEASDGDLFLVFHHQPLPTIRRYSRSGELRAEHVLRSPGLDRIAAEAIERQRAFTKDVTWTGGRVTVFSVAYDRDTDALWLATASDDGKGAIRVMDRRGGLLAQLHLNAGRGATPVIPDKMGVGGTHLFWTVGPEIYRSDLTSLRAAIRSKRGFAGRMAAALSQPLFAQTPPPQRRMMRGSRSIATGTAVSMTVPSCSATTPLRARRANRMASSRLRSSTNAEPAAMATAS